MVHFWHMTLADYIAPRGALSDLARRLGVSHTTVIRWTQRRVPAEMVRSLAQETGIPPHVLRPDLYQEAP